MKTIMIVLVLLAANSMRAQTGPTGQEFKIVPKLPKTEVLTPPLKPNTVQGSRGDVTYSGIIPQAVKTDNPWQLINPFAPASYGSGADNLDRDIITGKETGLKFFSIGF